ncbi:glycosyltransferase family 2 protein [Mariniflexile sp.]|uniref:glycosyltransferase family 2 protein n=1 Tax=Mariniflexile sp. TaxID=1979402 RepID=UPI004048DDFD
MKLTIIIPVYNAENYIESCLISCCKQDLKSTDYEIMVVNDGSTDNTLEKIIPFTKEYSNIHLKSQKNKGHGAARNIGVTLSKGKYIYFLDADDYIAMNTLGNLIELLEEYNLDMIVFSSMTVKNEQQIDFNHSHLKIEINKILSGIDFLGTHDYLPEVWRYITKKSFYLNSGVSFYDKKFVQDSFFTPSLISKTERISYIDYDVHRYRKSHNSISRNKSFEHLKTHLYDMCFSVHELYRLKNNLAGKGATNNKVVQRLHIKQQHYVFIIIFRFIRSHFKISELKNILSDFQAIGAYPLDKYRSSLGNGIQLNLLLAFIFNRKYLLYPSIIAYRTVKKLNFKLEKNDTLNKH